MPVDINEKQTKPDIPDSDSQEGFGVYCKCRQPVEGRMIECEDYNEWYHEDYAEVLSAIWQTKRHISWTCDTYVKKS